MERDRLRLLNSAPERVEGKYVLYWIQANRRAEWNHALSYAAELANEYGLPLLVYEGLTFDYKGANDRLHTFVLEGVPGLARDLNRLGAGYFFYLRTRPGDPNDVFYRLAMHASCVVTDDYPAFIVAAHNDVCPTRRAWRLPRSTQAASCR